jgi:thiamine-phosphate pyrophosphorylase
MQLFPYKLYLVISEEACLGRDLLWVAEEAVKGGVDIVQLREKRKDTETFTALAKKLKHLLDRYSIPLIINDNVAIAMAIGAEGVHVGNRDMPPSQVKKIWPNVGLLGYSIEYIEQLDNSEIQHAGHLGISPVFSTPTKTDTVTEWGFEGIARIRKLTDKPLVAIGNVNAVNAFEILKAGADCLAVVSAICAADNPRLAAQQLRKEIERYEKL